jgi:glutamate N-acetyltransferase/amino-acid N-acetyltransferase
MSRAPVRHTIPGFRFSGLSAGIKKSGEKDLALIFSETPAVTAALFTTNRVKAAPVQLSAKTLATQKLSQAVIINSGNANACTGGPGMRDARDMTAVTARELGIDPGMVHVSSTGIIGKRLPVQKIKNAVPGLVRSLSPGSLPDVASSIMTTDTCKKISVKKIKIGTKTGTVAGIAKGAGMICPHMATMLCFIVTDIAVHHRALSAALKDAVKKSFNRLIIDNDMSTNDTVLIMSNGMLHNTPITRTSLHYKKFEKALGSVTHDLAAMIAADGEGATKLVKIRVKGARTEPDAEKIAKKISTSMLVKTAIYGRDPNWGRIMAAIGSAGVKINEKKVDIFLDRVKLVSKGIGTQQDEKARKVLNRKEVLVTVNLHAGEKTAEVLTCDLTEEYIKINAHYST